MFELVVHGRPEAKGSMRVGRQGQVFSSNPRLKGWQQQIALAVAAERNGAGLLEGPLALVCTFTLARPPSHYVKSGRLRKGAPLVPGRPDLDKLVRGLLDALTDVLFHDDAQVAELDCCKVYGDPPGVRLQVVQPDYRVEVET